MKKILITGVAWFIGFNLAKRFLQEGEYVHGIDNLFSGKYKHLEYLDEFENFDYDIADIRSPLHWLENDFDEIYNLACPASPVFYQSSPLMTLETSTLWMQNILDFSHGRSLVLQVSTSEVYGDPLEHPQKEDYKGNVNTVWPRACYDEWKRVAETMMFEYNQKYHNGRIIRIFNTYWPWMRPDDWRVISNFIWEALHNEDLTIYGDWEQTRSFQYIDDLLDGMIAMMRNKSDFFWPVNIGTQYEFTMNDLAELVLKLIPESKSSVVHRPLPKDDPRMRRADNSLAKEKLWWEPKVTLEEWLKKTIEYFRTLK